VGDYEYKRPEWKVIEDDGDDDFMVLAKKLVEMDQFFNINGIAGAGKTTLAKLIIKLANYRKW